MSHLSKVVRKPLFCICENKGADQLRGNHAADQHLRFHYIDPSASKIQNLKPLAVFCDCTAQFVSDIVGNPEDKFSHDTAHFVLFQNSLQLLMDKLQKAEPQFIR